MVRNWTLATILSGPKLAESSRLTDGKGVYRLDPNPLDATPSSRQLLMSTAAFRRVAMTLTAMLYFSTTQLAIQFVTNI
jgi:hypothetical protein